ncbi:MAG: hypothetical protein WA755_05640 [Candidatus Acidiferrales bacterium]
MTIKNKHRKRAADGARPARRRANLNRHKRVCAICRHAHRDAIEEDFLRWVSPADIAEQHKLYDRQTIYRHAHATGLWERRRHTLRFALESLIERAGHVKVTGDTIIRAVIAHTRINDDGKWIDPPQHTIVTRERAPQPGPNPAPDAEPRPELEPAPMSVSGSHKEKLEDVPTH